MDDAIKEDPIFDKGFDDQGLIQENKYCRIWWAIKDGDRLIVKTYHGFDTQLAEQEAEALDLYHDIASKREELIDSRCLGFEPRDNLLSIAFVEGECFTDLLYRARSDKDERKRAIAAMSILGRFSRQLWDRTRVAGGSPSPFMYEYLLHCSRRLEAFPILGRALFKGTEKEAARLWADLVQSGGDPSYAHGDYVFRNVHVQGNRVGLIDFANAIPTSHVLNDAYNLHFALANTWLSKDLKADLWKAYQDALGMDEYPEAAHRFYFEYHRRRWLQLKLWANRPWPWMQAARAIATFAAPCEGRCAA